MTAILGLVLGVLSFSMFQAWIADYFVVLGRVFGFILFPFTRININLFSVQPYVYTTRYSLIFIILFKITSKYLVSKNSQ